MSSSVCVCVCVCPGVVVYERGRVQEGCNQGVYD